MNLYFLRHGEAEDGIGISDHERRLTQSGITRTENAARVIAALNLDLQRIFSSPHIRAKETAEIVAKALNMDCEIRDELKFGFDMPALDRMISGFAPDQSVMFVGHEPTFSMVIENLTGGNVEMKKGGLARVEITKHEPLRGTLVWLIAPKVFDVLAGS